jgi:hypothetical protein
MKPSLYFSHIPSLSGFAWVFVFVLAKFSIPTYIKIKAYILNKKNITFSLLALSYLFRIWFFN